MTTERPKFVTQSSAIDINAKGPEAWNAQLAKAAEVLSKLTGKEIRWHYIRDSNCAVWGDFGFFIVKDPIPHIYINRVVTDDGVTGDLTRVEP